MKSTFQKGKFKMGKIIIDVPMIAYRTWCIIPGHMKDGKFVEDEENDRLEDLRKDYPYSKEHEHVM